MVFEGLISFLPVSTHFLHMKAAERGAMEPAGWHGHSRATTERHIDKITSYEHFSKDFVPHRSVGRYPVCQVSPLLGCTIGSSSAHVQ